jgi:hypothetical protein
MLRRHNFGHALYSTNNAIATTPQPPHHSFLASHHHGASQHSNMAAYEAYNMHTSSDAQHSPMNNAGQQQQREDSYSSEETPTKRQKYRHQFSPDQQHDTRTDSPTTDSPYLGINHTSALSPTAYNDAFDSQFDMLPPPNSAHASWQVLHDYAQSHASEHGYALSINTTAKNRLRIKLACVCYGQPKNTHKLTDETRVRKNRVSYKTGCKMWIEGKKQDDGTWLLRVGEPEHNHPGRESGGWAVQRKRTWGIEGGRIGSGGVTAKEELAKLSLSSDSKDIAEDMDAEAEGEEVMEGSPSQAANKSTHSLERCGLVWKIVEQEMLRKGEPNQGRDRGVGRTVEVLQARLPGIHIFKRDVYNIRAQIKRARKAAGQQLGDGISSTTSEGLAQTVAAEDDERDTDPLHQQQAAPHSPQPPSIFQRKSARGSSSKTTPNTASRRDPRSSATPSRRDPRINPALIPLPPPTLSEAEIAAVEIQELRRQNAELRRLLVERMHEVKEKSIEMAGLRSQIEILNHMVSTSGGTGGMMAG